MPEVPIQEFPPVPLQLRVVGQSDIDLIHDLSAKILEETGIIIHYPAARDLLQSHGATVDEGRQLVRIPRNLVEGAIKSAPSRVILHSQNDPGKDCYLAVDGGHYFRPTTGLNWIVDSGASIRREVTQKDVRDWTRVAHALPNIHIAGSLEDQEAKAKSEEVRCLARMVHHTDKPFMFSAFSGEGMRWLKRILEVVQAEDRQQRLMVLSSVNSPLTYAWGQCEAAMVSAEVGIPVCFNSSAVAGVTAPATLAGAVAQINAEMLGALTMIQLHRPGAPVVYAAHPLIMDMKTGFASISTVEVGLMSAACIEVGRHYGLPTASNGICTDACTPDAMATLEKWGSGFLPAVAGANVNGGAGSLSCVGTVSLEQLVIDDDVYGHFARLMRGLQVDTDSLASSAIAEVGAGGDYLMHPHTIDHMRSECYFSPLANRMNAPRWESSGARDLSQRAVDRVHQIMETPEEKFLSEAQSQEVKALLAEAEETLETMDLHI